MRHYVLALLLAFILAGCGGSTPQPKPAEATASAHDHAVAHEDGQEPEDEHHHHHHAPTRGGTLVELGDHVGNIEFVLDSATGTLTAYCSDAHAENPVRLKDASISVNIVAAAGAAPVAVSLAASANPLTGETVGDTSQFEAVVEALKGQETFEGTLAPLEYRGVHIEATKFSYTASAPK